MAYQGVKNNARQANKSLSMAQQVASSDDDDEGDEFHDCLTSLSEDASEGAGRQISALSLDGTVPAAPTSRTLMMMLMLRWCIIRTLPNADNAGEDEGNSKGDVKPPAEDTLYIKNLDSGEVIPLQAFDPISQHMVRRAAARSE